MLYIGSAKAWLFETVEIKIKILYNFFIENIIDRYGIDIQWIKNFRRPEWIFV